MHIFFELIRRFLLTLDVIEILCLVYSHFNVKKEYVKCVSNHLQILNVNLFEQKF